MIASGIYVDSVVTEGKLSVAKCIK